MENNMLKIQFDLSRGAYVISRNNGGELETVVKEIDDKTYNKDTINKRRKEIEAMESFSKWIASDLLKLVDPALYDALEEFDEKYGTEYRHTYTKIATMNISYTEVGVHDMSRKNRKIYTKRASEKRAEKLQKAGISIDYDVDVVESKSLGFADKMRVLQIARAQRVAGAAVKIKQKESLVSAMKNIGNTLMQGVNNVRNKMSDMRNKLSERKLAKTLSKGTAEDFDDIPDLSEEELAAINSGTLAQTGVAVNIIDPIQPDPVQTTPDQTQSNPVVPDPVIGAEPNQSAQQIRGQKPKKDMSRSKSIQASKQAARNAGKLKNSYQERIKAKADAKKAAEEGRKKAEAVNAEKARKAEEAAKLRKERKVVEKAIEIQQKKNEAKAKREAEEAARALNEKKLSTRLSRKLRSVQDSIRNKVHMPDVSEYGRKITGAVTLATENIKKMKEQAVVRFTRTLRDAQDSIKNKVHIPNLTGQQKVIAGVAVAIALTATIGAGVATSRANAESLGKAPAGPTAPIVEVDESIKQGRLEMESLAYKGNTGDKKDINTNKDVEKEQESTETNAEKPQEKSKEEQQKEYLSSIRVGSNMKIESGKYFASPDGTGAFGKFENYKDGVSKLTIIDIITDDGYIVVTDSNVSLYELKQQYPNAKFSYHFEFEHSDGRTTTQGWLTENSMEQEAHIENNQQQVEDDGR